MVATDGTRTTTIDPLLQRVPACRPRRVLMTTDGLFLALIGGVQVAFELMSYYAGAGPHGTIFDQSPYTIGWVENHGLAFLIGMLFLVVAARDGRLFWHGMGLAVHVLLAVANVAFWSSFVTFDVVPMGIAATVAHIIFIAAHSISLSPSRHHGRPAVTS